MPLLHLRRLTGRVRTRRANRELAAYLCFVAGAVNVIGLLAVGQYTSHMSGIVSTLANHLAAGAWVAMAVAAGAVLAFIAGGIVTAILVHWARRRRLYSEYAIPLLLEAALLLEFSLFGASHRHLKLIEIPLPVILLSFTMGLQNAIVTKLSRAEIRTTHVTGMITDIGIELGKLLYRNRRSPGTASLPPVRANRDRLGLLTLLVGLFFAGGVAGALAFQRVGFLSILPLAVLLVFLAALPIFDDLTRT